MAVCQPAIPGLQHAGALLHNRISLAGLAEEKQSISLVCPVLTDVEAT